MADDTRLINSNALKEEINAFYDEHFKGLVPNDLIEYAKAVDNLIDNAPTIEQEIYITGEASNLYIDGYREGMKDYKQLVAKVEELEKEKRPQGEWIKTDGNSFECPFCHRLFDFGDNYCGYCGAKMKGGAE